VAEEREFRGIETLPILAFGGSQKRGGEVRQRSERRWLAAEEGFLRCGFF